MSSVDNDAIMLAVDDMTTDSGSLCVTVMVDSAGHIQNKNGDYYMHFDPMCL